MYFICYCRKNNISSGSDSDTSCRREKSPTPFANIVRGRVCEKHISKHPNNPNESDDEDATFNEIMGKFDESFIYEKETDILSDDTDPSEYASELDTGLDGGDEYDTDEILENDYIGTGSVQGFSGKDFARNENVGGCAYYANINAEKKQVNFRKPQSTIIEAKGSKRRKRLTRTRKRNETINDSSTTNQPIPVKVRGSRSVGGTPVSLRRKISKDKLIL